MSKRLTAALLIGAFTASSAALAQGMSFEAVDLDQDGYVSFEEIAAAVPTLSEDAFNAADSNQDSLLDPEEFSSVQPSTGLRAIKPPSLRQQPDCPNKTTVGKVTPAVVFRFEGDFRTLLEQLSQSGWARLQSSQKSGVRSRIPARISSRPRII